MAHRVVHLCLALFLAATACSSNAPQASPSDVTADIAAPETVEPSAAASATVEPPAPDVSTTTPRPVFDPLGFIGLLASDDLMGRNNNTELSTAAREILLPVITELAEPAFVASGNSPDNDGFLQEFLKGALARGTNIVGVMPGLGELANEYIMIGAHYDHLGEDGCNLRGQIEDTICNGAADNAAGVAVVLAIAHAIAEFDTASGGAGPDRRSAILAFWDSEEDGLAGSRHYTSNPAVPLTSTVAYINFDIQGAALTPAVADMTLVIGAETGGPTLVGAVQRATAASDLRYLPLSIVFGQGRSDHASLAAARVPIVFFTDGTNGCYHTPFDDLDHLDGAKLAQQISTAMRLTLDLLTMPDAPALDPTVSVSTFDDAAALLDLATGADPDLGLLPGDAPDLARQFQAELSEIVAEGPEAYDAADFGRLAGGAVGFVNGLAESECLTP